VVEKYLEEKHAFILRVLKDPKILEEITGLRELQADTVDMCEWEEEVE
jgi:hypothetical protein